MADAFDYDGLSNRVRKERQSAPDRLTRADATLYSDAEAYIRRLAEEAQKESQSNAAGAKATLLLDELRNARRALEDLYDMREHKILILAAAAARGASVERTGMTKPEQELLDQLVRLLRDARRQMLRHGVWDAVEEVAADAPVPRSEPSWPQEARIVAEAAGRAALAQASPPTEATPEAPLPIPPAAPAAPMTSSVMEIAPLPAGRPAGTVAVQPAGDGASSGPAPSSAPRPGRVVVRVLEEIEPFTASDLRTYRLATNDIVALPKEAAKALVLHGKATYVVGS